MYLNWVAIFLSTTSSAASGWEIKIYAICICAKNGRLSLTQASYQLWFLSSYIKCYGQPALPVTRYRNFVL